MSNNETKRQEAMAEAIAVTLRVFRDANGVNPKEYLPSLCVGLMHDVASIANPGEASKVWKGFMDMLTSCTEVLEGVDAQWAAEEAARASEKQPTTSQTGHA